MVFCDCNNHKYRKCNLVIVVGGELDGCVS